MQGNRISVLVLGIIIAGCDGQGPAGPGEHVPDPVAGRTAFVQSCAPCHASGDGLDLVYFDFPATDIVRRGVDHVDTTTARDIVGYLETLQVERQHRDVRLFQPAATVAASDVGFWRDLVGADGWDRDIITVEWLRSLDLRDIPAPLPFPLWSSERDESDWMPEVPLAEEIQAAEGDAVRDALAAYYADPTTDRLLAFVSTFRQVVRHSAGEPAVCAGSAAAHPRPKDCFEARRWASSLTAVHLLREGRLREVPYEVAHLWWEVGEAGVTAYFDLDLVDRTTVAAWLYMSSVFAPEGFPGETSGIIEEAGYMGQFLQSSDRSRLAVLVTLKRLVSEGPVHRDRPYNSYRDVELAIIRSPRGLLPDVMEFGLEYLLDEQSAGRFPTGDDLPRARTTTERYLGELERAPHAFDPDQEQRVRDMIQQLLDSLPSGMPTVP